MQRKGQTNKSRKLRISFSTPLAPRAGFGPATYRLTGGRSTTELPGKILNFEPSIWNLGSKYKYQFASLLYNKRKKD
jgi:hypothetical protein